MREDSAFGILTRRVSVIAPAHAEVATAAAWAIVHGLATLALDTRIPSDEDHARAVLRLFVDGLATVADAPST